MLLDQVLEPALLEVATYSGNTKLDCGFLRRPHRSIEDLYVGVITWSDKKGLGDEEWNDEKCMARAELMEWRRFKYECFIDVDTGASSIFVFACGPGRSVMCFLFLVSYPSHGSPHYVWLILHLQWKTARYIEFGMPLWRKTANTYRLTFIMNLSHTR